MEEGFVLMNLPKHKRWRAHRVISMNRWRELIQRMIMKQQIKNEQIKKTVLLFCLNSKKTSSRSFKRIYRK